MFFDRDHHSPYGYDNRGFSLLDQYIELEDYREQERYSQAYAAEQGVRIAGVQPAVSSGRHHRVEEAPVVTDNSLDQTSPIQVVSEAAPVANPSKYVWPPLVGVVWFLIGWVAIVAADGASVGTIFFTTIAPLLGVLASLVWWLADRHQVDPAGTERRLQGIGWTITGAWLGSKAIKHL